MEKNTEFRAVNHGKKAIELSFEVDMRVIEGRPSQIHLKEDGSIKDGPILCLVLERPGLAMAGFVSIEMLDGGLRELGYKIEKL